MSCGGDFVHTYDVDVVILGSGYGFYAENRHLLNILYYLGEIGHVTSRTHSSKTFSLFRSFA